MTGNIRRSPGQTCLLSRTTMHKRQEKTCDSQECSSLWRGARSLTTGPASSLVNTPISDQVNIGVGCSTHKKMGGTPGEQNGSSRENTRAPRLAAAAEVLTKQMTRDVRCPCNRTRTHLVTFRRTRPLEPRIHFRRVD